MNTDVVCHMFRILPTKIYRLWYDDEDFFKPQVKLEAFNPTKPKKTKIVYHETLFDFILIDNKTS